MRRVPESDSSARWERVCQDGVGSYIEDAINSLDDKFLLKKDSPMLLMVGQSHLPDACKLVSNNAPNLNYLWTLAELNLGNVRNVQKREGVLVCWKPILWYVKGKKKSTVFSGTDVIMKGAPEKEFWEQQQSVPTFEELIKRVTKPGDVVLDPFLGTGTTGVAAVGLKRRFIGSEIDGTRFLVAKKRIDETKERNLNLKYPSNHNGFAEGLISTFSNRQLLTMQTAVDILQWHRALLSMSIEVRIKTNITVRLQ